MQLKIGATVKGLRKEKNVTQEELAEHLGISFQAVSKWENDTAYPDITLLPALANFFGISIDQLFGSGNSDQVAKVEAVLQEYRINSSKGLVDANEELLRTAISDYPTEWRLVMALARTLFGKYSIRGDQSALEEVIRLCESVLRSCVDDNERFGAIQLLAYSYNAVGDTERAMAMARRLPDVTQTSVLASVSQGEDKRYVTQLNIFKAISDIGFHLDALASEARLAGGYTTALELLNLQERVLQAFFLPHDYLFLHTLLTRLYHHRAKVKVLLDDHDGAVSDLRRSAKSAIAYEQLPQVSEYTVPCLDLMTNDKRTVLKNYPKPETEIWLEAMEHRAFDPIRTKAQFVQIQELLGQHVMRS